MKRKKRIAPQEEIVDVLLKLRKHFSGPGTMELGSPFRTLVGVVLSARTRDDQVLKILPRLFKEFPDASTLAEAPILAVQKIVSSLGFFRQKAKNLVGLSKMIGVSFHGRVPSSMEGLVQLPGVGRKTASILLVSCFGVPAVAVDTHVHRVTNRLGWVRTRTAEQTERALLVLVPDRLKSTVNRVFVKFGRKVCVPRRPRCWACPIASFCRFPGKILKLPAHAEEIMKKAAELEQKIESLRRCVIAPVS